MAKDQLLSLVRAMDAALKDGRHEVWPSLDLSGPGRCS